MSEINIHHIFFLALQQTSLKQQSNYEKPFEAQLAHNIHHCHTHLMRYVPGKILHSNFQLYNCIYGVWSNADLASLLGRLRSTTTWRPISTIDANVAIVIST